MITSRHLITPGGCQFRVDVLLDTEEGARIRWEELAEKNETDQSSRVEVVTRGRHKPYLSKIANEARNAKGSIVLDSAT